MIEYSSFEEHGPVVQSVSTPACHAGGRRFESVRGRQQKPLLSYDKSGFLHDVCPSANDVGCANDDHFANDDASLIFSGKHCIIAKRSVATSLCDA